MVVGKDINTVIHRNKTASFRGRMGHKVTTKHKNTGCMSLHCMYAHKYTSITHENMLASITTRLEILFLQMLIFHRWAQGLQESPQPDYSSSLFSQSPPHIEVLTVDQQFFKAFFSFHPFLSSYLAFPCALEYPPLKELTFILQLFCKF